jgi:hypothetical protein
MASSASIHTSATIRPAALGMTLLAAGLIAVSAPIEQVLGTNARLVYLHGAWVWAALVVFVLAVGSGAIALSTRQFVWHAWSQSLSRAGLFSLLLTLPLSLLVMRVNWGGYYFDEPRWRILFPFAVAGLLLQLALTLINTPWVSSTGNLIYGVALLYSMSGISSVLHPDSPILTSTSASIRTHFIILVILFMAAFLQIAAWWRRTPSRRA